MRYGEFMERVLILTAEFHCSMTSGMRTKERNRAIGGAPTSRHILDDDREGWGQDIVPNINTLERRIRIVARAHQLGLGALDETDHVHIQWPRKGSSV